jgi:ubiquitin-protein ligase
LVENHDDSKLSHEEFIPYRKKFFPCSQDAKKVFEDEFDLAWEHHKKKNPHHWEYWLKNKPSTPYDKSLYAVEMICDWMAMGYKFGDTAEQFYQNNKHKITLQVPEEFIFQIFEALKK